MSLTIMLVQKTGKHPVLIFWDAICYNEIRWHQEKLGHYYMKFCEAGEIKGSHLLVAVPQFVEDYALDVLAGRAEPIKMVNRKEISDGGGAEIPRGGEDAPTQ